MINSGVFQANDGGGLPAASALTLNNAVLQSDGPAVFNRTLGTNFTMSGSQRLRGHRRPLHRDPQRRQHAHCGATRYRHGQSAGLRLADGQQRRRTAPTRIDLTGAVQTVQVNAGAGGDSALLSGNIIDSTSSSTAGLNKTGAGLLALSGNNTFSGGVTITPGHAPDGQPHRPRLAVTPTVTFSETATRPSCNSTATRSPRT